MSTNIEVAGVVLALLPQLIEASKFYQNIASNQRLDEGLGDFYDEFYYQSYFLKQYLRRLIDDLPGLDGDCKEILKSDASLVTWEDNPAVKTAVLSYFGSQDDLDMFLLILSRVMNLLDRLVKDRTAYLTEADKDTRAMYLRLKRFASYRQAGVTSSSIRERIHFFRDKKNRMNCIKNLKIWNERLSQLSPKNAGRKMENDPALPSSLAFAEFKMLFNSLVRALGSHWDCKCSSRHQAMLCLRVWPPAVRGGAPAEFEVLLPASGLLGQGPGLQWLEGRVLVQSRSFNRGPTAQMTGGSAISNQETICDLMKGRVESSLRFLVEVNNAQETLCRLTPRPRKYYNLNGTSPKTLQQALAARELLRLKDKRVLALSFAYALLNCYGSPCVREPLRKESIYFYTLTENNIDFGRPFLATKFSRTTQRPSQPNPDLEHSNAAILNLGILLLEIHTGKLLETFQTSSEASDRTVNTDLFVARRVVKTELGDTCTDTYKNAIWACLDIYWVAEGNVVDLGEADVSLCFYREVIHRLERELALLVDDSNMWRSSTLALRESLGS